MGSMTDEQTADWFKTSPMMTRVCERLGWTLDDILDGDPITGKCRHPIAKKLIDGTPVAITVGCAAPDGPLHTLEEGGSTSTLHAELASAEGGTLSLVIFGCATCPMFMGKLPAVMSAARPWITAKKLSAVMLYIREAHPTDGWSNGDDSPLPKIAQTHTMADRRAAAARFAESAKEQMEGVPIWLDDPSTNALDLAYEAPPARLVVLDKELNVVYATGQAPLQYDVDGFAAFLERAFAS